MCAQRNQHGNLNTRRGTSSDRWLHVDDITTQPGPHEPHPSRAPPWPEVGAKVQRVVGKVERQPAARLLRRQQPRLGRRAAHEACTVDGRGVSCGSQAREASLGRGQRGRMPPSAECRRRASSASKRGRGGLRSGAEGSPKQAGMLLMRRVAARAAASQPGQRAPGQATLTCSRAAGVHEAERVPQRLVLGEHGVEVVVQVRRRLLPERCVEARRECGVAHARPGKGDELAHLRVRVRCWR